MNNKTRIRLRNSTSNDVEVFLEPEATPVSFSPEKDIELEVLESKGVSIEVVVGISNGVITLSLWPAEGGYILNNC